MNDTGYVHFIHAAVVAVLVFRANASVWLDVPEAGNCRGDTVLTCHYCDTPLTNWTWSRKYGDTWDILMVNGTQIGPSFGGVKEEMHGWFSLIISFADKRSGGFYRCGVGQYQSAEVYLHVECKPERVKVHLQQDKRIIIQMKTVFPVPKIDFTLTDGKDTPVSFEILGCVGVSWLSDCTWISTTKVGDGLHKYRLIATTVTETVFTGNLEYF